VRRGVDAGLPNVWNSTFAETKTIGEPTEILLPQDIDALQSGKLGRRTVLTVRVLKKRQIDGRAYVRPADSEHRLRALAKRYHPDAASSYKRMPEANPLTEWLRKQVRRLLA
jgi:hypothetical protein